MRIRVLASGLLFVLVISLLVARENSPGNRRAQVGAKAEENNGEEDNGQQADRDGIRQASREFSRAFEKGDAKTVAAFWTERGEYQDDRGAVIRGRAAIEKAFRQFFKDKRDTKIEVHIESIRFLSRDSAVEEGFLRQVNGAADLPASTLYRVFHVREGGQWKIASSREWGAGKDRLEDLEWLIGAWKAAAKEQEVSLTFTWDKQKPFILGQFTKKAKGKAISSGSLKIGFDPQRGQLRSWHFEDDGGHGQSLWLRDGNRWIMDSIGVLGDGTETASVNVLTRRNHNEFTWRSVDRVAGEEELPDTLPIKLVRVDKGE